AVHYRTTTLVRGSVARFKELVEGADVVSEGAVGEDIEGAAWFGSTSLVLLFPGADAAERAFLASWVLRDPHVRLRAVRVARREASLRAPSALGRATCELKASPDPRGVRIDVDVQAPLIVRARRGTGSGPKPSDP
ncbi:MAG: hypothetical protein ABI332_14195, partial [Polyangiaceae bacterium]